MSSRLINENDDTHLSTLGPKKKLIRDSTENSPAFTSTQLFGIQTDLSNKQTKVLAQDLRVATGSRKGVESGFIESLVEHSHRLDEYFKEVKISYVKVDKVTKGS